MKKRIVLLSIMLLLVSGCSIKQLSNNDFAKNIDTILSQKTNLANVNFDGYEYYVPNGMKIVNKDDYNALLRDRFSTKYYLYIDVISYFHEVENTYKVNRDAYYSKKLNYNKKTGYLEINEVDNQYFVEFVFNYSKIEAYILQSVKFHDKVLESLIGDNVLSYKEESFNIFESHSNSDESVLEFEDYVDADVEAGSVDKDNFEIHEINQKR